MYITEIFYLPNGTLFGIIVPKFQISYYGQMMNYSDFFARYKLKSVNYWHVYSLRKSVTKKLSCCFETNLECVRQTYLDPWTEIQNFKIVCNNTYYSLLPRTQGVQHRVNKWNNCLNTLLTLEDCEDIFEIMQVVHIYISQIKQHWKLKPMYGDTCYICLLYLWASRPSDRVHLHQHYNIGYVYYHPKH